MCPRLDIASNLLIRFLDILVAEKHSAENEWNEMLSLVHTSAAAAACRNTFAKKHVTN